MLKGISPLISPELLATMHMMGHGDRLVLADAHFPGHAINDNIIRADGLGAAALLDAILPLFELDRHVDNPLIMMAPVEGDALDPAVQASYQEAIDRHVPWNPPIARIDRFAFYEMAKGAFAVVQTGETATYGNIALSKGVTPS